MQDQALKTDEKFTYHDYLHLPDDGKRYQIIAGELFMVPAPTTFHQRILRILGRVLDEFVTKNRIGEVFYSPYDVVLSDIDVVQPDILFVSRERSDIIKEKNIQGAPDLVVEILSPYSDKIDRISKTRLYARFGIREYWIVDPDKKEITVLHLGAGTYKKLGMFGIKDTFESRLLKGLTIRISEIFQSY
jgi:Uma2 family endonuclease